MRFPAGRFRRTAPAALAAACLAAGLPLRAAAAWKANFSERTPGNAALRSALVPGWGQWFNGERQKGALLGSSTLVAAGAAAWLFVQSDRTYDDYTARGVADDPLHDRYKRERLGAWIALGAVSAVYIYGIVDAYRVGRRRRYLSRGGLELALDGSGQSRLLYRLVF